MHIDVSTYILNFSALGDYLMKTTKALENLLSSIKTYITDNAIDSGFCLSDHAYLLDGCVCLYKKTKDKAYLDFVKNYIDSAVLKRSNKEDLCKELFDNDCNKYTLGTVSTFLFDETGDEKYKSLARKLYEDLIERLKEAGDITLPEGIKEYECYMPFYTDYETRWNKKNGYNDICDRFKNACDFIKSDRGNKVSLCDRILFLKSVVDSLSVLSIQIYEDYRFLEDILRSGTRDLFFDPKDFDEVLKLDDQYKVLSSYILFKGIKEGHISSEKYRGLATELFETAGKEIKTDDLRNAGAYMMAAAVLE